jgi:hypothetical protein
MKSSGKRSRFRFTCSFNRRRSDFQAAQNNDVFGNLLDRHIAHGAGLANKETVSTGIQRASIEESGRSVPKFSVPCGQ